MTTVFAVQEWYSSGSTFRKVFQLLDPKVLEKCFGTWVASLQKVVRGVIAIDGKTLRGSKASSDGSGAMHLLSAYACEAGLVIGQRAVDDKSNDIMAITDGFFDGTGSPFAHSSYTILINHDVILFHPVALIFALVRASRHINFTYLFATQKSLSASNTNHLINVKLVASNWNILVTYN